MAIEKGHTMKISRFVIRALCLLGLWLGLGLQAHAQTDTVTYVYTDPQGTPLVEADASGNIVARYDYTPYGSSVASLGNPPNGPGYTGHVNDPETGLVYMQARYYQPIGRFLSPDPVGPAAGNVYSFNRYDYANGNPVRFTDPDGRKCATMDGKASCTFDVFKDKNGNTISRKQALSGGSKLAKFFHADRGSRILRAEAAMTAKYSAAKSLEAKDGSVTIKGNKELGIPDQNVSGSSVVHNMETIETISAAGPSPDDRPGYKILGGVPKTDDGSPSNGPMTFWSDGEGANVGRMFGHEILHTIYSGAGLPNRGWANPDFNEQHQVPFDEASDEIR